MQWNPDVYLRFAEERTRPAVELAARIPLSAPGRVIDLGCGPGNSTAVLAARWPDAELVGLESSPTMLTKARASSVGATWLDGDVASWTPDAPYDVVFANAALHWIPNHRVLLPRLVRGLTSGGVLAFQVPRNFDAPAHVLMRETAERGPWAPALTGARRVHVETPETYFDILAPLARTVDIWETIYLHVLEGEDAVLAWVAGTGLRPFLERLADHERDAFVTAYRQRLRDAYPTRPDGRTLFPFRRLFVVARV